jgi:F-type H+-transporting ATPase subunit a
MFGVILTARYFLNKRDGVGKYIVMQVIDMFKSMTTQTLGKFNFNHCVFIGSLFLYIMFCNFSSLIPYIEEPTTSLNTTLALGLISFVYIQVNAIRIHGILGYAADFFKPFFLMLPLNLVGEVATVASISFRLFGNIFGGATISSMHLGFIGKSWILEAGSWGTGINFVLTSYFTIFEGLLQALVFTVLSLTYLAVAIQQDNPDDSKDAACSN